MINPYAQAAERGATWLAKRDPHWRERVNFDQLNMGYATRCVLGQWYGGFTGVDDNDYWEARGFYGLLHEHCVNLGFTLSSEDANGDHGAAWGALTQAWLDLPVIFRGPVAYVPSAAVSLLLGELVADMLPSRSVPGVLYAVTQLIVADTGWSTEDAETWIIEHVDEARAYRD